MLKGRWSANEGSFKSHSAPSGSCWYCQSFKNKLQREILIIFLSFFVSSQMIPRSPCISETTRVGPPSSTAVASNNCCCHGCCCPHPCGFYGVPFSASCFVFSTDVLVPDCILIFLEDMWLNQLINFIQPLAIMLNCPLWVAVINYNVWTGVEESRGRVPKSCSCIKLHFMSDISNKVTKAIYRRTMYIILFH